MSAFAHLDLDAYALEPALVERTLSPALVVHLPVLRRNVARMIEHAGGAERWRPHLKTTKTPELWNELLRAGLRQFKCATTREARELARCCAAEGFDGVDLLVAYPWIGPALDELGAIARAFPGMRLSVLAEDPQDLARIPAELEVFLDVNPGMHRTGLPLAERGRILELARAAGGRFRGVHFYDGHLHAAPGRDLTGEAHACYDGLMELVVALEGADCAPRELVTSGTPTCLAALAYAGFRGPTETEGPFHRISPGTVVLHDARSESENPELDLEPAAVLLTRVVSHPGPDLATCDAGAKSLAAEVGAPCAVVLGRPGLSAETPSEEHLPLRVVAGERPARGERLTLVPRHVCPTVNLAEELLLVDEGGTRVVPVRARAHDLVARTD